jgi:hypothetical protein
MPNTQINPHLRHWKKAAGDKPKNQIKLVQKHNLARPQSKDALAVAMALRPQGVTQPQIVSVLGKPHRNKIKHLVSTGKATIVDMPQQAGHKVYRLKLK